MKTQSLLAVVIVLLASTLCAAQSPYPEPCTFKTGTIYPWDWAVECFQSIPLQQGIKEQTIDALTKVVELYAFLDIANSSPDPTHLPMKVDLIKELLEINSRPYKFDYDFHDDLRALFLQLNDAHTQYYAPTCYQNIVLRQAFYPVQYVNSTQQQVIAVSPYFDSDVVAHFKSQGLDLTQYVGAQILSVNGVDGLSYFKEFANNSVGVSKDFGTRLNIAMAVAQPQPAPLNRFVEASYWQTRTKRNPFPRTPILYFDLKLSNGTKTTVEIPWVVTSKTNYNGIQSFLKDYYATPTSFDSKTPVEVIKKAFPQPPPLIEKRRASFVAPSHVDSSAASTDFTLLVNSTNLQFWMLNDSRTLVMYLDTMAPAHYGETFKALNDGFAAAAQKGLNRIIIDLTNNGGGNICFGASLLAYFQNHTGQNWGPQDLPLGLLQKDLTNSAVKLNVANTVWSPGFYDSQQGVHIANNDTSYIMPGVPHVRGGRLRNYSKLLHIDNCGNFGYRINPPVYFKPSETIILTQGFCGSTCAMFANHMALYDNVITVVVGGFPNRVMQYSSFPGLQVLDSPDIYSQFIQLGKNVTAAYTPNDLIPRELPTTATYRMCIREIYPPTKAYNTQPMEYTFQQANHHLNYTSQTAVQPEYIWYQATPFFSN